MLSPYRRIQIVALLIVFAVMMVFAVSAIAEDAAALIKKSDDAYAKHSGSSATTEEALAAAEASYAATPSYDAAWRAARACFWLCDRTEDKAKKKLYGKKGFEWGEKAMQANPNGVEGNYFYAISLGEYGKGIGILTAIGMNLNKKYVTACNKAISINQGYDHAGPLRALGVYYSVVPRPLYDAKKSEDLLLRSANIAPKMSRTFYYLMELYIKEEQWAKAKDAQQKILAIEPYADEIWEDAWYKEQAKKLSAKIK